MKKRFDMLNMKYQFFDGVASENSGLSCMYGHLQMLQKFVESNDPYVIICEDDVHLHQDFWILIQQAIDKIATYDIILLGYLYISKTMTWKQMDDRLYEYPDDLWGTQMYLISRRHAIYCLETFKRDQTEPFSADWTITKSGKRVILWPMIAVEEKGHHDHFGQQAFHTACNNTNISFNYI